MNQNVTTPLWQEDELENVACDSCQGGDHRTLFIRPDGLSAVECARCGLAFLNPRPRSDLVSRLYEKSYFQKDAAGVSLGYADYFGEKNRASLIELAHAKLDELSPFFSPSGRRCLEIGCATGEFCHVLAKHGASITGVDLSECAISEAQQRYAGIDFRVGAAEDLSRLGQFDAVFAFELIEHVTSPSNFLSSVASLLQPGGILMLSTPNLDCGRKLGFDRWLGANISFEHLYFLDFGTLKSLAGRHGLTNVTWSARGYGLCSSEDEKAPRPKLWAKAALKNLRLLPAARAMLQRVRPHTSDDSYEHTLYAVFQKT